MWAGQSHLLKALIEYQAEKERLSSLDCWFPSFSLFPFFFFLGAGTTVRTQDLILAKQGFYHESLFALVIFPMGSCFHG
jgi:hypothetical protein